MSHHGKVLIIGGGISGITAAVEASEAGADILLVEQNPYLGGRVAQMNLYFPKLCPPSCGLEINLRRFRTSPRIRYLLQAEVLSLRGEPGHYWASIRQAPQRISDRCTACGRCAEVCPSERADTFNLGLKKTRASYLPYPNAFPLRYTIDSEACRGSECGSCLEACEYDAIDLEAKEHTFEEEFGAVVIATGWQPYDARKLDNLAYGTHPNVITNLEMERLNAPDGPMGGILARPSDGGEIRRVAFVQCAGSRDENHLRHCSGICCMAGLKQTRYVRKLYPEAEILLYYIDVRSPGRLEDFYQEVQKDSRVRFIKGKVARVAAADANQVTVEAEDILSGHSSVETVDLVVLGTGIVPCVPSLSGILVGDEHGFLVPEEGTGLVPAGCVRRPVEVAEAVRDATAAALRALQYCRG